MHVRKLKSVDIIQLPLHFLRLYGNYFDKLQSQPGVIVLKRIKYEINFKNIYQLPSSKNEND